MARPVRLRRICFEPKYDSFAPCGAKGREQVLLTVDEWLLVLSTAAAALVKRPSCGRENL